MKKLDITGQVFGRLTVVADAPGVVSSGRMHRTVYTVCECGGRKEVRVADLRAGKSTSCGCFRKEVTGDMSRVHGLSGTRLYSIWQNMRNRCTNKNDELYGYYGARGITICPEWDDFAVFHAWATTHGYSDELTIERTNNDGNYHPGNCIWATRKVQANNRRPRSK